MTTFFLGVLLAGLVGGTFAYNCYGKREIVERSLKSSIANLEYNLDVIKQESELKVTQLTNDLKRSKEDHRKSINDIDLLNKDINSLKRQLAECKKALAES